MAQHDHDFDERARTWDADPRKLEMARKVADLVAARVPDLSSARVLEVGAGTGLLGFALRDRARQVTLADSSKEMLAVAGEKLAALGAGNVDLLRLDLDADPLPPARWDVACAQLVLHHVRDTGAVLAKLHAALAPGGHLCVCDLDKEDGAFHGAGFGGHDGFDRSALGAQLERAGFAAPRFETAFEIRKEVAGGALRAFPVFLAVARRP